MISVDTTLARRKRQNLSVRETGTGHTLMPPSFVPDHSACLTRVMHTNIISFWTTGRSGEDANDPRVVESHSEFWASVYS